MLFSRYNSPLVWAVLFPSLLCAASPTPVVDIAVSSQPQHDPLFREALELAHQPHLEKRLSADFNLERSWENHVLFAGSWTAPGTAPGVTETVSLSVTCINCWTKGVVTAKLSEDIVKPSVRLDFTGVEAYVDVGVDVSDGAVYAVNLFSSETPLGLGFPGLSVGLVFYVDLVFSLTAKIDLEGGFYVKLADDAFLEASIFGGDITDSFFDGISTKSLPVTVKAGSATFKADLRLRVQCGAEAGVPEIGIGASAELGIYANLIEFVAVLESTPDCALQSIEWWDLNVGAFARFDVVIDYKTLGAVPTVSTTLLTAPTLTQCWLAISPLKSASILAITSTAAGDLAGDPSSSDGVISATPSMTVVPSITSSPLSPSSSLAIVPSYPLGNSSTPFLPSSAITRHPFSNATSSAANGNEMVTSTIVATSVYTITSCTAAVPNCPASLQSRIIVTQTVDVYTTVCPSTANITGPRPSVTASSGSASAALHTVAAMTVITDVVVLVPCATPIVETFKPSSPSSALAHQTGVRLPEVLALASSSPVTYHWPNGSSTTTASAVYGTGSGSTSATLLPQQVMTAGAAGRGGGGGGAGLVVVFGIMAARRILMFL